ncbi:MAG: DUF2789 family protein [Candidatus Competibacteraceae bacterium]
MHGYHAAQSSTLFDQLGLPSDAVAIRNFIHWHRPLDPKIGLQQASWWTPAQAEFLQQAIEEDSDGPSRWMNWTRCYGPRKRRPG